MTYLIWEIVLYLLATATLAWLCGWLFTRASWKRKLEDAEVELMGHMHTIQKELDASQEQRDQISELLDTERTQHRLEAADFERVQQDLKNANMRHDERKQQTVSLSRELETASDLLNTTRQALEGQTQENSRLNSEVDQIRQQLTNFEDDLDEITNRSQVLKRAFDQARIGILERDRRIAELESTTDESLQMAAMSGNSDPELAISRIGRLQNRVQELFDEVKEKDEEIASLKKQLQEQKPSIIERFLAKRDDDLQQIEGLGEEHVAILRRLGVTSFKEIADWSDQDIERFDSELNEQGLIRRENWVGQAQSLKQQGVMKGH